jgi:peptidoglycan/LPS O-acetylase OafA/YrhL
MISRKNNFDLIRLFASFQVLFYHGMKHLTINSNKSIIVDFFGFFPGVLMFFTVSGFLIFSSLDRNKNLKKYFYNRFLRLFPALWGCFFFTLILLFVFKIINTSDLFSIPIIKWIFTQITFFQFWTPEILRSWGTGTPNGSLWTITVEIQFYILLPIVVLSFRKIGLMYKFIFLFIASVLFNIYISNLLENGESNIVKLWGVSVFPYLYCFLSGAILYLCWPKIRNVIEGKAIYWLLIFLAFSIFTDNSPSYFPNNIQIISNILLSILTISLAYTLPNLGKILKGNDISYGMYIYHMLVINSLIAIGFVGQVKYLLMAITLTIILSSLSWFLIEKKALSLKKKIK